MLTKHLSLASAAALCRGLSAFVFLVVAARALGAAEFGTFSYAFAFATVLGLGVDYGFQIKALKDMADAPTRVGALMGRMLGVKALFVVLFTPALLVLTVVAPDSAWLPAAVLPLFWAYSANSFAQVLFSPQKCQGNYGRDALQALLDALLIGAICVAALLLKPSPSRLAWMFCAEKLLMLSVATRLAGIGGVATVPFAEIVDELKEGASFAAHAITGALYLNADTFILRATVPAHDFGIYQAGLRIVVGAGMLLTVINSVFTPRFARYLRGAPDAIGREIGRGVIAAAGFGLLTVAIVVVGGDRLFTGVFGPSFAGLGRIAWLFMVVIALRIMGSFHGIILSTSGRQWDRVALGVFALLSIVALDVVLVPRYGISAAAAVLAFVHLLLTGAYWVMARGAVLQLDTGAAS